MYDTLISLCKRIRNLIYQFLHENFHYLCIKFHTIFFFMFTEFRLKYDPPNIFVVS